MIKRSSWWHGLAFWRNFIACWVFAKLNYKTHTHVSAVNFCEKDELYFSFQKLLMLQLVQETLPRWDHVTLREEEEGRRTTNLGCWVLCGNEYFDLSPRTMKSRLYFCKVCTYRKFYCSMITPPT